jgi:hypothetical protein
MDGLFESGDISFTPDGEILTGNLTNVELSAYGLTGAEQISVTKHHVPYLQWHRLKKYEVNG